MTLPPELVALFAPLAERGGPVVLLVLVLAAWMWTLIIERYWYVHRVYPRLRARTLEAWRAERPRSRTVRARLRATREAALATALSRHFSTIHTLVAVLPLLGLLGTVTGMITTFDLLTEVGNENPRELSRGIDHALVSTIAGLVTAISGLYFARPAETRALRERERLAALLI